MTGYLIFLFLLLGCGLLKDRCRQLQLLFIIIALFSGLRYGIGYDYFSYLEGCLPDSKKMEGWEPIPYIIALISSHTIPFFFFLVTSLFISFFYYKGLNNSDGNHLMEVFFYISFPFLFMNQLGIVRQGMASAIVFYAMTMPPSAFFKRILLLLGAFLCHYSAIIAIFILIPWHKISHKLLWVMFFFSFLGGFLLLSLVEIIANSGLLGDNATQKAESYLGEESFGEGNLIRYLIYFVTVFVLANYSKIVKMNRSYPYLIGCLDFGASLFAIFSFNISLAKRFCMFFFSSSIILIPQLIRRLKIPNPVFYVACILLFALTIYVGSGNIREEDDPGCSVTYPYRTIFDLL